jgi:hypothetical protein
VQAYLETTQWTDGSKCNHTYLLEGDSMLAYIPAGKTTAQYFSKPIRISRSGRKFVALATSPFDLIEPDHRLVEHIGSKGTVYYVDPEAKTCTCPGYTFRGSCKHVKELL